MAPGARIISYTLDSNYKNVLWYSLRGSEQLAAVGGQAVDGTVMSPDLTEGC